MPLYMTTCSSIILLLIRIIIVHVRVCMSLQTVEKWTLREIQEKMHGGSGPPSLNSKSSSVSNQTSTTSAASSSSNPPPPIPARRLASHPPLPSSGKTDNHHHLHQHQLQQGGLGVKEKDINESHSAPSSPTEKGHKDCAGGARGDESGASGGTTVSPRHSSRSPNYQRPKSVVVDMNSSGLNYAQVQFENGRNVGGRPKAAQRRNTKYTSIAYQPENATEKAKRSSKAAGDESDGHGHGGKNESKEHQQQQQARQPTSPPTGRNSDHHHHHHHHHHVSQHSLSSPRSSPVPPASASAVMDSAPTYDVPPPVPMRMDLMESNEGGVVGGGDKSTQEAIVHKRHSSDPFHGGATDPFAQDPFGGDSGASAWDDPAAFYDKPPSRQAIPARSEPSAVTTATTSSMSSTQAGPTLAGRSGGISSQQQLPSVGIVLDEQAINSADFTGESSYEDTMEVLQNLQLMKSGADPYAPTSAVFMGQDNKKTDQHSHHLQQQVQGRNEMSSPDSNQEKDSYQFPTELAKYPLKAKPEGGPSPAQATMPIESQPRCKEEPTLHTFNYSPKLPHSPAVVPTSSASGVTRHESFSRSSRNMPLPPLPTEVPTQKQQQQPSPWQPHPVDHAPPLPARTVPNAGGKPPLPGNHPSMRKAPPTDEQPPRLPPPNHPWGNKRHPGEPTDSAGQGNPPLPPRKKDGSSGAELPGAPPPAAQQQQASSRKDDLAMRELIALGYSKAEIDRALKITRNDYSMAKMILQEFGGRH